MRVINSEGVNNENKLNEQNYEFNSFCSVDLNSIELLEKSFYRCGVYDFFSKEEIDSVLMDPISNHETAIRLSNFVYTKNGVVSNSIDYMVALPCLDSMVISKNKKQTKRVKENKELMKFVLHLIDDKTFIRNALFTQANDGIAFFYFETKKRTPDNRKYLTDYEVENILEINTSGVNASIISLPWEYTKIVGKKNGRYVLAFNLRYFDNWNGVSLQRKLRMYPKEITDAYYERRNNRDHGDWVCLDNNKTMCRKIKCKDSEPWGRSLVIAALPDVLYKDYFVDTKRYVLNDLNSKIIYETYPEGKEKGTCALTKTQQENQHETVKRAIMQKNNRGGTNFFSVAAGTKIQSLDVSVDIFDEKNESNLNDQIALDLGVCASLIGAMSTGNFASGQNNLEMITAQLYTWVYEWQNELNYVINKNIIKDKRNEVEVYYLPTSFVNRNKFFEMMKTLYTEAGGSMTFLIASTGIDPDAYFNILDEEIELGIFDKYLPHQTSYTLSKKETEVGRPKVETPTNENTIASRGIDGNNIPSPSDNG